MSRIFQKQFNRSAQFGQERVQTCRLQLLPEIHRSLVLESHMVRREIVCFKTITKQADSQTLGYWNLPCECKKVNGTSDGLGGNGGQEYMYFPWCVFEGSVNSEVYLEQVLKGIEWSAVKALVTKRQYWFYLSLYCSRP